VAGGVVFALFVVLMAIGPSAPVHRNPPGFASPVAGIELAGTPEEVSDILGRPGDAGRADAVHRMRLSLAVDMLFLLAYPTLVVGIVRLLAARGRLAWGAVGVVTSLAVLMAVGDAVENAQIWLLTGLTDAAAMAAPLARLRAFTLLKWNAIFAAAAILAWGVRRERNWWRWSAPLFAGAAAVGLLGNVHRPAIEWGMALVGVAWAMSWLRTMRAAATA
jgi:hypothetical protein